MVVWDCSFCCHLLSALFKAPLALAPQNGAKALGHVLYCGCLPRAAACPRVSLHLPTPPCAPACCLCQLTVSAPVFDSSVHIDPQPAPLFPFPELLHPMSGEEEKAGALGLSLHSGEGWGGDSLSCCWGSPRPSFRALHYDI